MPSYCDNKLFTKAIVDYQKERRKWKAGKITDEPPIPEFVGKCILLICSNLASRGNFSGYCVDDQTEALTKRGWLTYDKINTEDFVVSMDIRTSQLKWAKVLDVYRGQYQGKMHRITGSTLDALVTPLHKFVSAKRGLVPIEDIHAKDHIITNGKPLETIWEMYSDDFVRLVGWYVTEGWVQTYEKKKDKETSYYVSISQSQRVNPENCEEIVSCIERLTPSDLSYVRRKHVVKEDGETSFHVNRELSKSLVQAAPNKVLSFDFIFSLSLRQRLLLIETMLKGDGNNRLNDYTYAQYFQKDKQHIDSFLALCVISGFATKTSYREWETAFGLSKGYTVTLTNRDRCYMESVNLNGGRRPRGGGKIPHSPTYEYDGVVWCPQTEFGTFMCRRGARVHITGNSWRSDFISDGVEKCVAAINNFDVKKATSGAYGYMTRIAWRAFLHRIEKENDQTYAKLKNYERFYVLEEIIQCQTSRPGEPNQKINTIFTDAFVEKFEAKLARKKQPKKKTKK